MANIFINSLSVIRTIAAAAAVNLFSLDLRFKCHYVIVFVFAFDSYAWAN